MSSVVCPAYCRLCRFRRSLDFLLECADLVLEQWSPKSIIGLFHHAMRLTSVPVHAMLTDALTDPAKLAEVLTFIKDLKRDTSEFNVVDFRRLCSTLSEKLENTRHDAVDDPSTTKLFEEYQDMCTKAMSAASRLASVCLGRDVSAADFLVGTKYAIKPPVVATP